MFYKDGSTLYFVDDSNTKHEICDLSGTHIENFPHGEINNTYIRPAMDEGGLYSRIMKGKHV